MRATTCHVAGLAGASARTLPRALTAREARRSRPPRAGTGRGSRADDDGPRGAFPRTPRPAAPRCRTVVDTVSRR